jgi:hypothetical protein
LSSSHSSPGSVVPLPQTRVERGGVGRGLGVSDGVALGELVAEDERVAVGVPVDVSVAVTLGVDVRLGATVMLGLTEGDTVGVMVSVSVDDGVEVAVAVAVAGGVFVEVAVEGAVGVGGIGHPRSSALTAATISSTPTMPSSLVSNASHRLTGARPRLISKPLTSSLTVTRWPPSQSPGQEGMKPATARAGSTHSANSAAAPMMADERRRRRRRRFDIHGL